jgi:hypothetical protein
MSFLFLAGGWLHGQGTDDSPDRGQWPWQYVPLLPFPAPLAVQDWRVVAAVPAGRRWREAVATASSG